MSRELRFSKRAVQDIEEVLTHTLVNFGEQQHEIYKSLIREALAEIAANPETPRAKHRPELHADARTLHLARSGRPARHFFLYRVFDQQIDIGRLLHDAMDLQQHLPARFDPR